MERCCGRCFEFFTSSIGKKVMVALAGLLLCGFLAAHLAGNLLLLAGEGPFNHYAETLEKNPLLPLAELGLLALFLVHIVVSVVARAQNMRARPQGYALVASKGGRTPGSGTMIVTGTLVLVFLIVHIKTFKFGAKVDGLYRLVMDSFANPYYAGFYVVAMAGIGLHLSHGFQSAFQTFGINHPRYTPLIKRAGLALAGALSLGFAFLPAWAYLKAGGCCR